MSTAVPMGIVSLKAEGAYAADKLYKKGMWVTSSGSSYAYINPTPSTGVPLTETTHWQQIASIGGQDLVDAAVAARDAAQGYKDAAAASAAQLAAGTASPAGTYANLAALNTANPNNSKIYITLDDGKWCYHNGSAFVAGGVYQAASVVGDIANLTSQLAEKALQSDMLDTVGMDYTTSGRKVKVSPVPGSDIDVSVSSAAATVKVKRCKKNLLDINSTKTASACTYSISDSAITVVETGDYANVKFNEHLIYPVSGDVYTLSFKAQRSVANGATSTVSFFNAANEQLLFLDTELANDTTLQSKRLVYTSNGTPFYIRLYALAGSSANHETIVYSDIQLELGNVDSPVYEAYSGNVYDVAITDGVGSVAIPALSGENNILPVSADTISATYKLWMGVDNAIDADSPNPVNSAAVIDYVQGLDGYRQDDLDDLKAYVDEVASVEDKGFCISVITDTQLTENNRNWHKICLYRKFMQQGLSDVNLHLGDVIEEEPNCTKTQRRERLRRVMEQFHLGYCGAPQLIAMGNHDLTEGISQSADEIMPSITWYNMVLRTMPPNAVFPADNPYGGYYYMDFEREKIRIIVLQTNMNVDLTYEGALLESPRNVPFVHQAQLEWVADEALDMTGKTGWGIIFASHCGTIGDSMRLLNNQAIKAVMVAFQTKTSKTQAYPFNTAEMSSLTPIASRFNLSVDVDYTGVDETNEIICCLNGHGHYDGNTVADGILYIAIPGTDLYEPPTMPAWAISLDRNENDITAHAFDTLFIDRTNRKITIKRFGAGDDRDLTY